MMHTIPIFKAQKDFTKLVDNVKNKLDNYVITVHGKRSAMLISVPDYELMQKKSL